MLKVVLVIPSSKKGPKNTSRGTSLRSSSKNKPTENKSQKQY